MKIKLKNHRAELYVDELPDGAEVIGEVSNGALVLLESWEFVKISNEKQKELPQREVYTAIIKAILADYCDEQVDLAIAAGYSIDAVKSWSSGRRVPAFGTIKLLLLTYGIIGR